MSSEGWLNDVVSACVAAGIQEYVVCAGSRNLGLVASLSDYEESGELEGLRVYSHFEERAAGFFALGRVVDTGKPCAVITTSGTAVAELLPAVIEAHYQGRPLVVISADRPARFRNSGAPQAIQQPGLFTDYVERCEDIEWSDSITLFDGWSGCGPWHLNLCVEDVDLSSISSDSSTEKRLSKVRLGEIKDQPANLNMLPVLDMFKSGWKGLVVMLGGLEPEDRQEVWHFLRDLGVPVCADSTSGLREVLGKLVVSDADKILKKSPPAQVLRIGEVPVGRFWRDLEDLPAVEVVSLSRTGFSGLARESSVITGNISKSIRALGEVSQVGDTHDYLKISKRKKGRIDELLESLPESEPGMIRMLSVLATIGKSLYLGNSLPIREWNDFAQRSVPYELVRANRGANGIDGQIATWLGATADEEDAWAVLGDLTTLYDLSAPSLLKEVNCSGRMLVVINNSGGRIFERLPHVQEMSDSAIENIVQEHATSFKHWADMWGMDYVRVDGIENFDIEPSEKTTVVELIPDVKQTKLFWEQLAEI